MALAHPSPSPQSAEFERAFQRWAGHVRRRLAARTVLRGAALGLLVGAVVSALLFWQRLGELRPWPLALGALGALIALTLAVRRRWSDDDVALYLDAKLGSDECLVSAKSMGRVEPERDPAFGYVLQTATAVLERADPAAAQPRVFERQHLLIPIALAGIIGLSLAPLPKGPPLAPAAPGSDRVRVQKLRGLERIEALETLRGKNPEQEARLKQLAEQARRLRAELDKGMERRDALSQIAKLRDDVAAERLKLGAQESRPGLEAALAELEQHKQLSAAAKALGDGDLTAFDQEMQKLANQAERDAREAAKEALKEAAKAAREKGAGGLADALDAERQLFAEREAQSQALRELAEGLKGKLSQEALDELKEFGESGSPEAQKKLAEALGKALEGLSEEERKRLAERLKKNLEGESPEQMNPLSKQQLEELARRLASPEGEKELLDQLRELANAEPSEDAQREQGLGDAERGGAEAQRELGAVPIPMQGGPGSSGKPSHDPGGKAQSQNGSAGPGGKKDTGKGDHAGGTPEVSGRELRARAQAAVNPGVPLNAPTVGHAPGRAGETANQKGTGSLGNAREAEVGAVERSDIPEEYREHVGRYFEP